MKYWRGMRKGIGHPITLENCHDSLEEAVQDVMGYFNMKRNTYRNSVPMKMPLYRYVIVKADDPDKWEAGTNFGIDSQQGIIEGWRPSS